MTRITFYRCALLLGLLVPAVLWLFPALGSFIHEWDVLEFTVSLVPIAGIPFVLVACAAGAWLHQERSDRLPRVVWLGPVLFALVFLVWCTARTLIANAHLEQGFLPSVWAPAVGLLEVGYLYVAVVEIGRTYGERQGWLRPSAAA